MTRRWVTERRSDHYYRKAKRENYRSRASYKLMQIDERFHILRKGMRVADLGAAPGGWLQVAKERVGDGVVVGVDLDPIRPMEGVTTIRGDMTEQATVERLIEALGGEADVVISDMSPNISGNYHMDHARSIDLCMHAIGVSDRVLRKGGSLVMKVFMGDMMKDLRREVNARFDNVKVHSPPASRSSSSEVYIVAKGHRGKPTSTAEGDSV